MFGHTTPCLHPTSRVFSIPIHPPRHSLAGSLDLYLQICDYFKLIPSKTYKLKHCFSPMFPDSVFRLIPSELDDPTNKAAGESPGSHSKKEGAECNISFVRPEHFRAFN
jgi:hypothetical protein